MPGSTVQTHTRLFQKNQFDQGNQHLPNPEKSHGQKLFVLVWKVTGSDPSEPMKAWFYNTV